MAEQETADTPTSRVELAQRLLTEDANLVASLEGVAAAGCALLDGCEAASITIIDTGRPLTVAATARLAREVDQAQYDAQDGPCLEAARSERLITVARAAEERRWPRFGEAARRVGVGSSLSVPLHLPADDTYGGLNCYALEPDAFGDREEGMAQGFAAQASAFVANALAYWDAFDKAANMALAMEHRAVIEQAKGVLMVTQKCTADEAFDLLRRASQRENRKLRDLAADIVARTTSQGRGS